MSISIAMNAFQFEEAVKKLSSTEGCTVTPAPEGNPSGHLQTQWIDVDYAYRIDANTLLLMNEHKHGLTKFVTDDTIATHIISLLGELPTEPAPVAEASKEN